MTSLRPVVAAASLWFAAATAAALPLESTRLDFVLPGTQPLTLTHPLSPPPAALAAGFRALHRDASGRNSLHVC